MLNNMPPPEPKDIPLPAALCSLFIVVFAIYIAILTIKSFHL